MTKRSLPALNFARPDYRVSAPTATAMNRWEPSLRLAASAEEEGTISILDVIGEDWDGGGVTARRVAAALRSIGDRDVRVAINSPGGDYFEGMAIYNMLRAHPGRVTVQVFGMAASAASLIAMAADELLIGRAAFLMIHNTWVVGIGDRHGLRAVSDWLEPFDAAAAEVYAARTGQPVESLAQMMDAETWMGGAAAVDQGFADGLLPADAVQEEPVSAEAALRLNLARLNAALARDGMSRSERRKMIKSLYSGTPSAADDGTPGAALEDALRDLRDTLKAA
jgi:ATP-dependent Clp protease protease subunit